MTDLPKGYAAYYPLPEYPSAPLMGRRALMITSEQRERARARVPEDAGQGPVALDDAAGRGPEG